MAIKSQYCMKFLGLFLVIALPLCCDAASRERKLNRHDLLEPEYWPQACRQLQQSLRVEGEAEHLLFSPKPARNKETEPAWWLLQWQGVSVPIPVSDYRDVLLLGRKNGVVELLLRGDEVSVALMRSPLDAPMDDFPALVMGNSLESPAGENPEERLSLSAIIGNPVSSAEVMLAAYRIKNITCAPGNRRDELMAMAGLPLIRIAGPYPVGSVHENVGTRNGWLEVGETQETQQQAWRAITLGQPALPGLQIEIVTPIAPRFAAIGLEIGATDARGSQRIAPVWLTALQAAVTDDTPAAYLLLRQSLQDGGMSARSLRSLESIRQTP